MSSTLQIPVPPYRSLPEEQPPEKRRLVPPRSVVHRCLDSHDYTIRSREKEKNN